MRISVWVDWRGEEILTNVEFEERLEEKVSSKLNDDYSFSNWLGYEFTMDELFELSEKEKEEVKARYVSYCEEEALGELKDDYCEYSLDIEG